MEELSKESINMEMNKIQNQRKVKLCMLAMKADSRVEKYLIPQLIQKMLLALILEQDKSLKDGILV